MMKGKGESKKPTRRLPKKKPSQKIRASQAVALLAKALPKIYSQDMKVRLDAARTIRALAFAFAKREGKDKKLATAEKYLSETISQKEKIAVSLYRISRNEEIQKLIPDEMGKATADQRVYMKQMRDTIEIRGIKHLVSFIV